MSDPMWEIRDSFFVECEDLLENLHEALETLEQGGAGDEEINVAFRAVHSIKGGAGAFGFDQLVAFAHAFETVMDSVRIGALVLDDESIQLFFQCGDMLSDLVNASRNETLLPGALIEPLMARLGVLSGETALGTAPTSVQVQERPPPLATQTAPGTAKRRFEVTFSPHPDLYRTGNEPLLLLYALSQLGSANTTCTPSRLPDLNEYDPTASHLFWRTILTTDADEDTIRDVFDFVEGLCTLEIVSLDFSEMQVAFASRRAPETSRKDVSAVQPQAPPQEPADVVQSPGVALGGPPPGDAVTRGSQHAATVRVDLDRVDRLVNLVGELVINQAMLSQSIAATGLSGLSTIATGLDEFQQLTRDIQDSVMMIRAQPVKSLFQRMGRIVREASASVGKTVRFRTDGETTEIDKTVIERLVDPLTHMIRNAVDHGLEPTEARLAAGKPAEGHVTLSAAHRSGRVIIELTDDGSGINRKRVKSIAERKGLIPPGQDLSDAEIDALLFLPGFSTAKEVSNLSGRGVGMDVVRSAISALGGRISISSARGKGTTFSISLPLTLAVLDGMVVTVGGETLVLPLSSISETLTVGRGDVSGIGPSTRVLRVRDAIVPLIDLGAKLGYAAPRETYDGAIVLLISQEDGKRAALVVDGIEDQRQVVIKGLEESYGRVHGVAAATILGDGQIALILDPTDLLSNASGHSRGDLDLARVAYG